MAVRRSRRVLTAAAVLVLVSAMVYAFWPRPLGVDIGRVERGSMMVTIDEQGRTRVHDAYVVSAPVSGRLLRSNVDPGDLVQQGKTVIAQMLPENPSALDIRTREQAQASVAAAEAALRLSRADYNKAMADRDLARDDLDRTRRLAERGIASDAELDRARNVERKAIAALDTSQAAISMREAELANARARLIGFDDRGLAAALGGEGEGAIPLLAPGSGRILRVMQQSETAISAGTPILEIGDVEGDLEVVVELLSADAVQVSTGNPVLIEDWGGPNTLRGVVKRIDPFGFTKFSALGVEEQRVNTVVDLTSAPEDYTGLGHGFRVEVRIVIWETSDAVIAPASALFRRGEKWAAYRVEDGRARQVTVDIGRNNGIVAEVIGGLLPDDRVVLYPAAEIADGTRITQRHLEQ